MTQTTTTNPGTFQLVFFKSGAAATSATNNVTTQTISACATQNPGSHRFVGTNHRVSRLGIGTVALGAVVAGVCANGCHKQSPAPTKGARRGVGASGSALPIEQSSRRVNSCRGDQAVYGPGPSEGALRLTSVMPGISHATGSVSPEDAANYVRDRVDVRRVELGAVGTFFPAVHILGGDPSKVYRIEVNGTGAGSEIVSRDVTPQPAPHPDPNIDDAERWRRAGYAPNGNPLDPMNLR